MVAPNASTDDLYLPLAFSMYSTPGAYAVLAGAGVSMGAKLPTAWDIVVDLAQQLCRPDDPDRADLLTPANVEDWYVETYNKPLTYSGILEQVADTPHEREAVLRRFFEPRSGSDGAAQRHAPSAAHHAVADMMAAGTLRVVVTMNFDHLFEDALSERHIDPVIVRTDNDAAGLAPLHTIDHLVVHLHGDYRDPASMLNTGTELSGYQPHMQQLLAQIVANHGLLIAGWSAEHDHALRAILRRAHRRFYTPGWINPGQLGPKADELARLLGARVLHDTADGAFVRLSDAVIAMRRREARHPLTPMVAVDRIKRDLTNQSPAITAHDTLTTELANLDGESVVPNDDYHSKTETHETIVERLDERCRVPAAAVAALAYWGSETTDGWWMPAIEQWSRSIDRSGLTKLLDAPLVVGVRLFYAAGIAAAAAKRYDLLADLLALPTISTATHRRRLPACITLDWNAVHQLKPNLVDPLRERFASLLSEALAVSPARLDILWQEFETLRVAGQILTKLTDGHLGTLRAAEVNWEGFRDQPASDDRREAYEGLHRQRATIARLAKVSRPHIFVSEHMNAEEDQWIAPVAQRLSDDPARLAPLQSLATEVTDDRRDPTLPVALAGAQTYFHLSANRIADSYVGVGVATVMPQELWLDESKPGAVRI